MARVALGTVASLIGGGALWVFASMAPAGCTSTAPASPPRPPVAQFTASPPLGPAPALPEAADNADLLAALYEQLRPGWDSFLEDCRTRLAPEHPLNRSDLLVRLRVVLDASGHLDDLQIVDSSGVAEFDRAAVEVVRDASPFAAPARQHLSDDGRVHVTWAFARDVRQASPVYAEVLRVTWPIEDVVARLIELGDLAEAATRLAGSIDSALAEGPVGDTDRARMIGALDQLSVAVVKHALADGDRMALAHAVSAVQAGQVRQLLPALRKLAGGVTDASVRAAAARALGEMGDRDAMPVLRQLVLDTSSPVEVVSAAITAMIDLGAAAELREQAATDLMADDDAIRWRGLLIASHVAVPDQRELLTQRMGGTSDGRLERLAAAQALGAIAGAGGVVGQEALSALLDHLTSKDAAIRAASCRAIAAAASAGAESAPAYRKSVRLLADRDERVRAAAITAAVALDSKRFANAMGRLRGESSEIVLVALADALAEVPGVRAKKRLSQLVRHDQAAVRRAAAGALLTRDEGPAMAAGLLEHPDADIRLAAIAAAANEQAVRALLHSGDWASRVAALDRLLDTAPTWPTAADAASLMAQTGDLTQRAAVARVWLSHRHALH